MHGAHGMVNLPVKVLRGPSSLPGLGRGALPELPTLPELLQHGQRVLRLGDQLAAGLSDCLELRARLQPAARLHYRIWLYANPILHCHLSCMSSCQGCVTAVTWKEGRAHEPFLHNAQDSSQLPGCTTAYGSMRTPSSIVTCRT